MTNQQMIAGRFLAMHRARQTVAAIRAKLAQGRTVYLSTYGRHIKLTAKHADMIRAGRDGLYVQRGKAWDFAGGCRITVQ